MARNPSAAGRQWFWGFSLLVLSMLLAMLSPGYCSYTDAKVYKMANGMTVIMDPDANADLAVLDIYLKAGSSQEGGDNNGISHFYEHLFFRGTPTMTGEAFKRRIEELGGEANGETTKDFTHYYLTVPSTQLKEGISLFADALMHTALQPESIEQERTVIINEWQLGEENPVGLMQNKLYALAYQSHAYKYPVIGNKQNLENLKPQDFLSFKNEFYTPQRTILVLAGNFDERDIWNHLEKVFAGYKTGDEPEFATIAEPYLQANREEKLVLPVEKVFLGWGFRVPGIKDDKAIPPLDVLAFMLGQGEDSILNTLKQRHGLTGDLKCDFFTTKDSGLFILYASSPPAEAQTAKTVLGEAISRIKQGDFSAQDFQRGKNLLLTTFKLGNTSLLGMAGNLGFYATLGNYKFGLNYENKIAQVTAEQVKAIAAQYFNNYVSCIIEPLPKEEDEGY